MFKLFGGSLVVSVVVALLVGCEPAMAQPSAAVARPIQRAFDEAEALFENLQQSQALELFTQVVDSLMPTARAGTLSEAERDMLLRSLSYRARAGFNVGQSDIVDRDLEAAIRLEPGFDCAPRLISPGLIEACTSLRSELVGRLELLVSPSDAEIQLDGRPMAAEVGPIDIMAGPHLVTVNRPGYAGERVSIDVEPGEMPTLHEVVLTRVSAVLQILTRPAGATVHVNTVRYGPTEGEARPGPSRPRQIEGHPVGEFSDELTVPGIRPGAVSVVVTLDGFRTARRDLNLAEPADYPTHFVLERAEGTVMFDGLPGGSTVEIGRQGDEMRVVTLDAGRLTLPIGVYDLAVAHPDAGFYQDTATVIDRREYLVPVRLRPSLTVLGILGDDPVGRETLIRALGDALGGVEEWTLQDRTEAGASILEDAGLTSERLRRRLNSRVIQDDPIDWEAVQDSSAREGRSSVYLTAVLDNDLSATYADLWMWRSAPDSALASRVRVPLSAGDGQAAASAIRRAFSDIQLGRPWVGALLIDVDSESGPFVVDVTDASPAKQAGLEPGDVIVAVNGLAPAGAASVYRALADSAGGVLTLQIARDGVALEIELAAGDSPLVELRGGGDIAYAAAAAGLAAARMRQSSEQPDWVWELNDAATRLHGGDLEGALEILRRTQRFAPDGLGVGRGTFDYWLGTAFTMAGPEFRTQAQQGFARAAEDAGARLGHNDGPWVAPRARARLAWLTGGE